MKHINDIIQESLLDDDDVIMANAEIATIDNWIKEYSTSKTYKIDPKTKEINAGYLNIAGPVPPFIKFGVVGTIYINLYDEPAECEIELPRQAQTVKIISNVARKITLKHVDTKELIIISRCEEIVFPKKFKLETLAMRDCENVVNIENLKGSKIQTVKLPAKFCSELIKQQLKLGGNPELYVFGNKLT